MIAAKTKSKEERNSIYNGKIIIGKLSRCIDSSCTGWYVDSLAEKYWIECLDPKHFNNNNNNQNNRNDEKWLGYHAQPQNHIANGFTPTSIGDNPK